MTTINCERILGCCEVGTSIGIVIFWMLFFTLGLAPANPPACYFPFEHSFLLPDSVLVIALVIAGSLLITGRRWGRNLSFSCAGGLIFLGLQDFSFNIRSGIYSGEVIEGVWNAAINFWCIGFGIAIIAALLLFIEPAPDNVR